MIDKFCESFLLKLRRKRESYIYPLISGSMKSMEDYKGLCSKIQALDESEVLIKETFNEFFGENEKLDRKRLDE